MAQMHELMAQAERSYRRAMRAAIWGGALCVLGVIGAIICILVAINGSG